MDKDAIKAAVQKQRTFKHDIEGRGFTILLPTIHERHVAYLQAGGEMKPGAVPDMVVWALANRRMLETAIKNWINVKVDDFLSNGDNTEAEFDAELIPLLLDAKVEWTSELSTELITRIAMHRQGVEDAKKKSVTT